jgi:hypothetical protein
VLEHLHPCDDQLSCGSVEVPGRLGPVVMEYAPMEVGNMAAFVADHVLSHFFPGGRACEEMMRLGNVLVVVPGKREVDTFMQAVWDTLQDEVIS